MIGNLILFTGFFFTLAIYWQPCRDKTLTYSIWSSFFYAIYAFLYISPIGGIVGFITIVNTIIQLYSPRLKIKNGYILRLCISSIFAITGTIVFAQSQADYLPLMAFVINCFGEASINKKSIYKIYALSLLCWICYAFSHGAIVYGIMDIILLLVNLIVLNETLKTKSVRLLSFWRLREAL